MLLGTPDSTVSSLQPGPLMKKFKLKGSSVLSVLVITQNSAGGSHVNTKLGEIAVQIFTEIEQNHDGSTDDSDYSSQFSNESL